MYAKKLILLVCLLCGLQSSALHAFDGYGSSGWFENVKNGSLWVLPGFITGLLIKTQIKKPCPTMYAAGFFLSLYTTAHTSKPFFDANPIYFDAKTEKVHGYQYNPLPFCIGTGLTYSAGLLVGFLCTKKR